MWEDPFLKPCYLFALVAGDLAHSSDSFTTCSGRKVDLRIFVQQKNIKQVDFAMQSLKHAMKWDEARLPVSCLLPCCCLHLLLEITVALRYLLYLCSVCRAYISVRAVICFSACTAVMAAAGMLAVALLSNHSLVA